MIKIGWWRHLQTAEFLNHAIVEVDTAVVLVIEGRWAVPFTCLFSVLLLQSAQSVVLFAFRLGGSDLNLSFLDVLIKSFSLVSLFGGGSDIFDLLLLSGRAIFIFDDLFVFGTEVYQFLTLVDLSLIWVPVELL